MQKYVFVSLAVCLMLLAGCPGQGGGTDCPQGGPEVCGSDGLTYSNSCLANKAGAAVSYEGECTTDCSDEDGGKEILIASGVSLFGEYEEDYCAGTSSVMEFYCENSSIVYEEIECPAGYTCNDGACEPAPCSDSDGGIVSSEMGVAVSGMETKSDSCASESKLTEYYCAADGTIASEEISCPSGQVCSDGECVEPTCEDSDGGIEISEAGTTEKGSLSNSDSCVGSAVVKEYYCENGAIASENIDCPSGEVCLDGACIEEPACTDSDGGKDKFSAGTTSYMGSSSSDTCDGTTAVTEYYCEGTEIKSVRMVCGEDSRCDDGECVEVECTADSEEFDDVSGERTELMELDDSDMLRLYVGEAVEVEGDMFLRLEDVWEGNATFRLFEDYDTLKDEDELCEADLEEDDEEDDLCDEGISVLLDSVSESGGYVKITLDEYYVAEYADYEGYDVDWSGSDCEEGDMRLYISQTLHFYPRLDTDSAGVDLEDETFWLFGLDAELTSVDIDDKEIRFDLDGDDYTLEDRDEFEYGDNTYEIRLYFTELGLEKIIVKLS
ncbi:hypothetical protein JW721_00475 [Candidatus Micrarchaeota archaeon]|nr:hypothetical protein [Candidatus Micrarchaeota archaeon]